MTDFIIVGRGLAATCLMHAFHQNNISFVVIGDENLSSCSRVAAGIWNPVVFKRLTKSWMAEELIRNLKKFYAACETYTGQKFITLRDIIRPFSEEQEKQLWIKKSRNELEDFLDQQIHEADDLVKNCRAELGYSLVKESGNLDVKKFLEASLGFFSEQFIHEKFDYEELQVLENRLLYKEIEAGAIVFCEGHLIKNNPFFNWIPLKPAKGEIITIKAASLEIGNSILNKSAFMMRTSTDIYKVGATYEWEELNDAPRDSGVSELSERVAAMITVPFEVVKKEAGVRPSTIDRRPVIGSHPALSNLYVFNGLGSKGVMLAPYIVNNFVNFYLQKQPLLTEINVTRFYHLYAEKK